MLINSPHLRPKKKRSFPTFFGQLFLPFSSVSFSFFVDKKVTNVNFDSADEILVYLNPQRSGKRWEIIMRLASLNGAIRGQVVSNCEIQFQRWNLDQLRSSRKHSLSFYPICSPFFFKHKFSSFLQTVADVMVTDGQRCGQ